MRGLGFKGLGYRASGVRRKIQGLNLTKVWSMRFYAGRRMGLRCRCDSNDLSAVRFVYRYVI